MARKAFDQELQDLEKRLQELGRMVEEALVEAVDALKRRDLEKASANHRCRSFSE